MSSSGFTAKEKKRFLMRKYIKDHLFDFILALVCNCLFTALIVHFGGGTRYGRCILLAVAYTVGKAAYSLRWYRKDYLNVDILDKN